jgi:hypothetical protein
MKLIEINWNPTVRQRRQIGAICLFALPLVGWSWSGSWQTTILLLIVGCVFALVGAVAPIALKPVFLTLTMIATPIGMVLGEIMLLLIYFGVFLPMGLIFYLMKRDALELKLDRHGTTYWQPKKQPSGPASYYRQS